MKELARVVMEREKRLRNADTQGSGLRNQTYWKKCECSAQPGIRMEAGARSEGGRAEEAVDPTSTEPAEEPHGPHQPQPSPAQQDFRFHKRTWELSECVLARRPQYPRRPLLATPSLPAAHQHPTSVGEVFFLIT